jgi:hypothetical protein
MDRDQPDLARNVVAGARGRQARQCGEGDSDLDETAPRENTPSIEDNDEQAAQDRPGERELGERRQWDPPASDEVHPGWTWLGFSAGVIVKRREPHHRRLSAGALLARPGGRRSS